MLLALQHSMNDKIIRSFAQETEDNFNKCIEFRDVSHEEFYLSICKWGVVLSIRSVAELFASSS